MTETLDGCILIADDDAYVRDLLKVLLEKSGYAVFCANDGMSAVELAMQEDIHLAILDIEMPRLDGIGALKKIKAADPAIEVLIITGNADVNTLRSSVRENGAFDYILKPFHRDELLKTIHNALMKRAYALADQKDQGRRLALLECEFEERTRQLRESQIQYQEIVENSGDGIMIYRDNHLLFVNSNMTELTGRTREDITRLSFETLVFPQDREAVGRYFAMILESPHTPPICRFRLVSKIRGPVWVEAVNKKTLWREKPAVLSFCRDITERKKAEESLKKAREDLEIRVQERTAQLSMVNARLREEIVERKEVEADLKGLLKKQDINIELAKKILTLINGRPARHIPLPGGRRLFIKEISLPCQAQGGDHFFLRTLGRETDGCGVKTILSLKDESGHAVNCVLRSIGTDLIHQSLIQRLENNGLENTMKCLDDLIQISGLFDKEDFITAVTVEIDHQTLTLRYLSNGHPPFLLIRGDKVRLLGGIDDPGANTPLAWGIQTKFSASQWPLEIGDRLLFFTDGLNEMPQLRCNKTLRFDDLLSMTADIAPGQKDVTMIMERLLEQIVSQSQVTANQDGNNTSGDDITLVGVEIEDSRLTCEETLRPRNFDDMAALISELFNRMAREWKDKGFENPDIRLYGVLEETLWNAWRHGNKTDPNKAIFVRWRCGNDFVMEVEDQGEGFACGEVPDPRKPENLIRDCGRGIFFIRHFADEASWEKNGRIVRTRMDKQTAPRYGPEPDALPIDLWAPL